MRRLMVLFALYLLVCAAIPGVARATISGQKATNNNTTLTYTYVWTGTVASYDVFVDTDQKSTTGFTIGTIGADYLLQDDWLYRFVGTNQSTWSWTGLKQITFWAGSPASWTVNRSDLKETNLCSEASYLIFRTEDTVGNPVDTSTRYTHTFTKDSSCTSLKLGVASYFEPFAPDGDWDAVMNSGSGEVAFVIVNPDSGPGNAEMQSEWGPLLAQLKTKGIPVYGYITSRQDGTGTKARFPSQYQADINHWYDWYGSYLTGLFIDEVSSTCTSNLGPNREIGWNESQYYKNIVAYMKQAHNQYAPTGGVKIILNPGTQTEECMFTVNSAENPTLDIIQANFEASYLEYQSWKPRGWETKYPKSQFWHLVHTASKADMEDAINRARSRHVGYIYVTDTTEREGWIGCTLGGVEYGTWNLLPGRCSNDTSYWSRLKQLTD